MPRKIVYIDAFAGVSGNMLLGAFFDLGVEQEEFVAALRCLNLDQWSLSSERVLRQGISGICVSIQGTGSSTSRTHRDIQALITRSTLAPPVKRDALATFERLAEVEAAIHGVRSENVHFHEVGALDSIIDIVGVAWCCWHLKIDEIQFSALPASRGFVHCDHGQLPLPAPATLRLLENHELCASPHNFEWVTPTGAALMTTLGVQCVDFPNGHLSAVGTGAGSKDPTTRPNLLRACVFVVADSPSSSQTVSLIETNLDDCTAEEVGFLLEQLWQAKPYDVWTTAITMKKNRPAQMVSVLCEPAQRVEIESLLFTHSTTFGVRCQTFQRTALAREKRRVDTPFGVITVKDGFLEGRLIKSMPEYEECAKAAQDHHVSIRAVFNAVQEASK
ncbi:MAG: nickel pincer cofactor biosynthesis protein LarC [Bradymonadia bacterium]